MNAAAVGSIETMKVLIDRGADVNLQNDFGSTLLCGAPAMSASSACCSTMGQMQTKSLKPGGRR